MSLHFISSLHLIVLLREIAIVNMLTGNSRITMQYKPSAALFFLFFLFWAVTPSAGGRIWQVASGPTDCDWVTA